MYYGNKKVCFFSIIQRFLFPLCCFSIHQIRIWNKGFDRNNLWRWERQRKIIKLRQGFYTFPAHKKNGDAPFYAANKIYAPSYISLETARSYFGIIPEAVVSVTSVTARKTKSFQNDLGDFVYRSVKAELMFGYTSEPSTITMGWNILIATPEKAILDFLYLNPHYRSKADMQYLRFDADFIQEEIDLDRLEAYLNRFGSESLRRRAATLKEVYQ
jgi:predicted transcriptional regulator of viral defense system